MSIFQAIAECLLGSYTTNVAHSSNKDDTKVAADIIEILYTAEKNGAELKQKLHETLHAENWTESLAEAILNALEAAVREGRAMSPALKEAYDKACKAADAVGGFAKEHPVFCTVIVLGILVLLMPWAIEAIGFAAEGPVEGKVVLPCMKTLLNSQKVPSPHCGSRDTWAMFRRDHYSLSSSVLAWSGTSE
jgi:hypothetical protein